MKKILLLVLLLSVGLLQAQETIDINLNETIPIDENVRIGTLDNGLKYYIRQNDKPADKVELRLVVNAGSMQENDDQQGLAHFMEHMNFNGTKHFKKNELVDYLQSIGVKFGAHLNAYTSFDETVYMLNVPTDQQGKVDTAMQILEDWAHNATLSEEEIDKERGVVLEEYRIGLGPQKRMREEYFPLLLHESRYADRLPIGKKNIIKNCSYEAIRSYYRDWYRPNLMAVVAVGDIDVDKMEIHIKEQFSGLRNPEKVRDRKSYPIPDHEETFISIQNDPEASNAYVQIVYKDPKPAEIKETIGDYREGLKRSLFTRMINNRIDELVNSDNPPFTYGGSGYGNFYSKNKNAYRSYAVPNVEDIEQAVRVLLEENKRVMDHGFTQAEFDRAKNDMIASLEKQYQGRNDRENRRIIWQYVNNYLQEEPIPSIEWELNTTRELLKSIKIEETESLINDYIRKDNRVIVITGPEKEDFSYPSKIDIRKILNEVDSKKMDPYSEDEIPENLISNIPEAGTITNSSYDEKLDIHTLTLSNGVKVKYKKTDFKEDEVRFSAFSFGGTNLLNTENYKRLDTGLGGITEAGYNGMSKSTMEKVMSGKIASSNPYIGSYSEGLRGNARPSDLESMFQLIHLNFTALNHDEAAYQAYANKQAAFYSNLMNRPRMYFMDSMYTYLNQNNPRFTGFPSAEDFKELDYDYAHDFYQERFSDADDFVFFFAGNFDEEELKAYAKTYLASLTVKNDEEKAIAHKHKLTEAGKKLVVHKGSSPKSNVRILYNDYVEYDSEDAFLLKSLGELLSIKLIEKLREQESGVYGVGANGSMRKLPTGEFTFSISFPCGPENVDSLVQYTLNEVDEIKENGPQQKDVKKVIEAQLLDIKESKEKNQFWLSSMQKSYSEGTDLNEIVNPEEKIKALKAEDLQKVANKYLNEYRLLAILYPDKQDKSDK